MRHTLLVPILFYGIKTMIWREKERFRIMGVQMENFRINRVSNAQIRECGLIKGVDEKNEE